MDFRFAHYPLAVLSLLAVMSLYAHELLLLFVLVLLAALMLLVRRSLAELLLFISCGLGGALAELVAIFHGTWYYSTQHFYGIPFWLPVLWGVAAIFIKRVYEDILARLGCSSRASLN
ncbi:MAG: hypothetical protein ACLFTH_03300 [Candidatus Woesearchaeota archaeon]